MDINDSAGDKAAGILTIPVLLGPGRGLVCASSCLMGALVIGTHGIHAPASLIRMLGKLGLASCWAQAMCKSLLVAAVVPTMIDILLMIRTEFDHKVVMASIDSSFKAMAGGLILLAILG
jgi:4-hydroxybenzoate polyprenyltransferase